MALWRVLADADRRSNSDPLDMLLFLKQNPQVRAQWTLFLDELDNKCADLRIPMELFRKSAQPSDEKKPKRMQSAGGDSGGDAVVDATASDVQGGASDKTTNGQMTSRVNWIELCFYLAVQLQAAIGITDASGNFPVAPTKKQRELWKKKKIKLILDVFVNCCEQAGDGDEVQDLPGVSCVYDGVRELKNGEVKWVFLCDLFLSELQEILMERWIERKNKTGGKSRASETNEGIASEDISTMLERMAQTSLGAGMTSIETSDSADLIAALDEITKRVIRESTPTEPPTSKENPSVSSTDPCMTESPISVDDIEFDADELEKLQMISSLLRDDYQTRRELMLERCDVTLRSFEWSKKLQEDASRAQEMKSELAEVRAKLTSTPVEIDLEELLVSGSFGSFQRAKLSAEELQIGSSVRNLLIGPVPDRGGRTNELQAKELQQAKKSSWNSATSKRRTFNQDPVRKPKPSKKKAVPENPTEPTESEGLPSLNNQQESQSQQTDSASKPKKQKNKPQAAENSGDPRPPAIAG